MDDNPYRSPEHGHADTRPPNESAAKAAIRGAKLGAVWVGGILSALAILAIVGRAAYGFYSIRHWQQVDWGEVWNWMFSWRILGGLLGGILVTTAWAAILCGAIMGIGTALRNRRKR